MRERLPARAVVLLTLPIALLGGLQVVRAALRPDIDSDFGQYYLISRVGLRYGFGSIYDLSAEREVWTALRMTHWFPNPDTPALAWLIAPLASLPYPVASEAWLAAGLAAGLAAWWLAAPAGRRALHLWLLLAFFPFLFAVQLGQVVPLVLLGVAAAYRCLRSGRDVEAGLLLGVLVLKPQLGLLLPFVLVAAGRPRAAASFGVTAAGAAAVALATLGPSGCAGYLSRLWAAGSDSGSTHQLLVATDLTVRGIVSAPAAWAVEAALAAAVLATARAWRHQGVEMPLAAGIVGGLLVTPFIHVQDLAMLVLAGWLALRSDLRWAPLLVAGYAAAELAMGTGIPCFAAELAFCVAAWIRRPAPSPARPAAPPSGRVPALSIPTPDG